MSKPQDPLAQIREQLDQDYARLRLKTWRDGMTPQDMEPCVAYIWKVTQK